MYTRCASISHRTWQEAPPLAPEQPHLGFVGEPGGCNQRVKKNKAKHSVSLSVQRLTLGDGTLAVDRPSTAPAGSVTDACTWNLT